MKKTIPWDAARVASLRGLPRKYKPCAAVGPLSHGQEAYGGDCCLMCGHHCCSCERRPSFSERHAHLIKLPGTELPTGINSIARGDSDGVYRCGKCKQGEPCLYAAIGLKSCQQKADEREYPVQSSMMPAHEANPSEYRKLEREYAYPVKPSIEHGQINVCGCGCGGSPCARSAKDRAWMDNVVGHMQAHREVWEREERHRFTGECRECFAVNGRHGPVCSVGRREVNGQRGSIATRMDIYEELKQFNMIDRDAALALLTTGETSKFEDVPVSGSYSALVTEAHRLKYAASAAQHAELAKRTADKVMELMGFPIKLVSKEEAAAMYPGVQPCPRCSGTTNKHRYYCTARPMTTRIP